MRLQFQLEPMPSVNHWLESAPRLSSPVVSSQVPGSKDSQDDPGCPREVPMRDHRARVRVRDSPLFFSSFCRFWESPPGRVLFPQSRKMAWGSQEGTGGKRRAKANSFSSYSACSRIETAEAASHGWFLVRIATFRDTPRLSKEESVSRQKLRRRRLF